MWREFTWAHNLLCWSETVEPHRKRSGKIRPVEARRPVAAALEIGPFEGSRWRLRRTRQPCGASISLRRCLGAEISRVRRGLLHHFRGGNTIANEGCLLTCLATVLRFLAPGGRYWTSRMLNKYASDRLYYTGAGMAMATLYADIV